MKLQMGSSLYGGHIEWHLSLPDFLEVSTNIDDGNGLRYMRHNNHFWKLCQLLHSLVGFGLAVWLG